MALIALIFATLALVLVVLMCAGVYAGKRKLEKLTGGFKLPDFGALHTTTATHGIPVKRNYASDTEHVDPAPGPTAL